MDPAGPGVSTPTELHINELVALIREGRVEAFITRAWELEPADLGDVLAALDEDERVELVRVLPPELSSHALIEMPEEAHAEITLAALAPERAAEIVEELNDDDAADILGDMEPDQQERILAEVEDRHHVDRLLRYDGESAGGLMTTHLVTVTDLDLVGFALEAVRRQAEDVDDVTEIFVVDTARRLVGTLSFKRLVVSHPDRLVRDVMEAADVRVSPEEDQEEVARLMARYNIPSVQTAGSGHLRRRDRCGRSGGHRGSAAFRWCLAGRGTGWPVVGCGPQSSAVALCQSDHCIPGRICGLPVP